MNCCQSNINQLGEFGNGVWFGKLLQDRLMLKKPDLRECHNERQAAEAALERAHERNGKLLWAPADRSRLQPTWLKEAGEAARRGETQKRWSS